MAGIMRAEAKLSLTGPLGLTGPLDILFAKSITKWSGPFTVPVLTGVTAQAVVAIGTQGLTTVQVILITSDQDLTITYNGGSQPLPLNANGVHLLAGTSLTAIAITNASGLTALLSYWLGGN